MRRLSRHRMRRGVTLVETLTAVGISTITLLGGVACYLSGLMSWTKGEGAMTSLTSSQESVRFISKEIREATHVTINSAGTQLTYEVPVKNDDGSYALPLVSDSVSRLFKVENGSLVQKIGTSTRTIATNVLSTDPNSGQSYKFFQSNDGAVAREIVILLVTSKPGYRSNWEPSRVRETVYLRNVPQLSR